MAHIDGGARGNPGPAGFGVAIVDEAGRPVAELSEYLGKQTNNYAEYSGPAGGADLCAEHGLKALKVFSDSELMVKQIKGQYKVNNPALKELHGKASSMIGDWTRSRSTTCCGRKIAMPTGWRTRRWTGE